MGENIEDVYKEIDRLCALVDLLDPTDALEMQLLTQANRRLQSFIPILNKAYRRGILRVVK